MLRRKDLWRKREGEEEKGREEGNTYHEVKALVADFHVI
jgi:hypothetical protein